MHLMNVSVSTAVDGDMSLAENRRLFCERIGSNPAQLVLMEKGRSGAECVVVSERDCGVVSADALVTQSPTLVLGLLTADCLPVALYEPHVGVALAHCGWSGVDKCLAGKTVEKMVALGGQSGEMRVAIGPCIKKEAYVVSEEKLSQKDDPAWKPFLTKGERGWYVDLVGYVTAQLKEKGVPESQISVSDVDTYTDTRYFSHRRAVETGENDGRMLTCVSFGKEGTLLR